MFGRNGIFRLVLEKKKEDDEKKRQIRDKIFRKKMARQALLWRHSHTQNISRLNRIIHFAYMLH